MTWDHVYRENLWNGTESRSGPGSGTIPTARTILSLGSLIRAARVRSVLDLGCGDGWWMPDVPGYLGLDPSAEAIARHRERHPDRLVLQDDGSPLPRTDLVIVRLVMQHLSLGDGLSLLDRVRQARPRIIVATTYLDGANVDIPSGADTYRVDLTADPFDLGPPFAVIPDGWDYGTPDLMRDQGCVLGLWTGR